MVFIFSISICCWWRDTHRSSYNSPLKRRLFPAICSHHVASLRTHGLWPFVCKMQAVARGITSIFHVLFAFMYRHTKNIMHLMYIIFHYSKRRWWWSCEHHERIDERRSNVQRAFTRGECAPNIFASELCISSICVRAKINLEYKSSLESMDFHNLFYLIGRTVLLHIDEEI